MSTYAPTTGSMPSRAATRAMACRARRCRSARASAHPVITRAGQIETTNNKLGSQAACGLSVPDAGLSGDEPRHGPQIREAEPHGIDPRMSQSLVRLGADREHVGDIDASVGERARGVDGYVLGAALGQAEIGDDDDTLQPRPRGLRLHHRARGAVCQFGHRSFAIHVTQQEHQEACHP